MHLGEEAEGRRIKRRGGEEGGGGGAERRSHLPQH